MEDRHRYCCGEFFLILAECVELDCGVMLGGRWPEQRAVSGWEHANIVVAHKHAMFWVSTKFSDSLSNAIQHGVVADWSGPKLVCVFGTVSEVVGISRLETDRKHAR